MLLPRLRLRTSYLRQRNTRAATDRQQRHHHAEQPKRPGEAPDQEVERDVLGVLDHEDEQQPDSGERGEHSAAELKPLSLGGAARAGIRTLLDHETSSLWSRAAPTGRLLRDLSNGATLPNSLRIAGAPQPVRSR